MLPPAQRERRQRHDGEKCPQSELQRAASRDRGRGRHDELSRSNAHFFISMISVSSESDSTMRSQHLVSKVATEPGPPTSIHSSSAARRARYSVNNLVPNPHVPASAGGIKAPQRSRVRRRNLMSLCYHNREASWKIATMERWDRIEGCDSLKSCPKIPPLIPCPSSVFHPCSIRVPLVHSVPSCFMTSEQGTTEALPSSEMGGRYPS